MSGQIELRLGGNGSSGHLTSELLKDEGKFEALHVPYKGGAPAINDLLGERISFMSINPLEVISHIQAGRLRALAVMDKRASPLLPSVPTVTALLHTPMFLIHRKPVSIPL
jgi:tripartite-type tricarboxylate transporter receptor subunit TctC